MQPPATNAPTPNGLPILRHRKDNAEAAVPIAFCADDYGLSTGCGVAIRRLIEAGRLTAVSCLTTTSIWPDEAARLRPLAARLDVGLHFNLTLGAPLGAAPRLAPQGRWPSLRAVVGASLASRLDPVEIAAELDRQLDAFAAALGRPPDFIDGHQHVHQLPGVRSAVVEAGRARLPAHGWVRHSSMTAGEILRHRPASLNALAITLLGCGFGRQCGSHGLLVNRSFAGMRRFRGGPPFLDLLSRWLEGVTACGLVMCHPGLPDPTGSAPDRSPPDHPLAARIEEFEVLFGDDFPRLLALRGVRLARLSTILAA